MNSNLNGRNSARVERKSTIGDESVRLIDALGDWHARPVDGGLDAKELEVVLEHPVLRNFSLNATQLITLYIATYTVAHCQLTQVYCTEYSRLV